jgi:hypothetical protein
LNAYIINATVAIHIQYNCPIIQLQIWVFAKYIMDFTALEKRYLTSVRVFPHTANFDREIDHRAYAPEYD